MTAKRLVLVPLDGSEPSETAIPMARSIFRTGDMAIAFVHVRKNDPLSEEELRDKLGLSPSDHVLHAVGDPVKEICRIANEHNAWVIVMSTQAETASREDRFGSTLAEVIGNTDRAVVAVRPDMPESRRTPTRISRVLLPLDGSPGAAAAVQAALDLTLDLGARLELLHIHVSEKAPPEQAGSLAGPKYVDAPHHEWPAWKDEFVRRFGPGAKADSELVEFHATPGEPGEQILRFAEEHGADLIGMAWRQNLDPGRAEIVKRLLAASKCPLLFVPVSNQEGQ